MAKIRYHCTKDDSRCEHCRPDESGRQKCNYYVYAGLDFDGVYVWELRICPKRIEKEPSGGKRVGR